MEQVVELGLIERRAEQLVCVETLGLMSFPARGQIRPEVLMPLAALPPGQALGVSLNVAANGMLTCSISHFSYERSKQPSLLSALSAWVLPGCETIAAPTQVTAQDRQQVVPMLVNLPKQASATTHIRGADVSVPTAIKPVNQWSWDIVNALTILTQNGGGGLEVRIVHCERTPQLTRQIEGTISAFQGQTYGDPTNDAWPLIVAAQRAILQNDAAFSVEVSVVGTIVSATTLDLVALALFGTRHDTSVTSCDATHRCLTGASQAPIRLFLLQGEVQSLQDRAATSAGFGTEGSIIGNIAGTVPVYLGDRDRARHLYVIGSTGTGKSTLLRSLIAKDIARGLGVIVIDPHGDLSGEILSDIPRSRKSDLIFADAADENGCFALNLLPHSTSQTDLEIAIDALTELFQEALYVKVDAFGPIFDQYFRNGLALLMSGNAEQRQLSNLVAVFTDAEWRKQLLEGCTDLAVKLFWQDVVTKMIGDQKLSNLVPYITSKLTRLVGTSLARRMFPRSEDALDICEIMNTGKILILRCPKGDLGEGLSSLGVDVAVMKVRQAAMARASNADRRPVSLYIDEFQGCSGGALQQLMAEGRKFGVNVTLANQSLGQIGGTTNGSMGSAILANVGNLITFRVGAADALAVSPWLGQDDQWQRLCRLPDFTMSARVLRNGKPVNIPHLQLAPYFGDIS